MCLSTDGTDDENPPSRHHKDLPARPRHTRRPDPHTSTRHERSSRSDPLSNVDPLALPKSFFIDDADFPALPIASNQGSRGGNQSTNTLGGFLPNERHPREQHEHLQGTPGASSRQTAHTSRSGKMQTIETNGSYKVEEGHLTFDRTDKILRDVDYTRIERDMNTAWTDRASGGKGKASNYRYHSIDTAPKSHKVEHWKARGHEETNTPGYGRLVQSYFSERVKETPHE